MFKNVRLILIVYPGIKFNYETQIDHWYSLYKSWLTYFFFFQVRLFLFKILSSSIVIETKQWYYIFSIKKNTNSINSTNAAYNYLLLNIMLMSIIFWFSFVIDKQSLLFKGTLQTLLLLHILLGQTHISVCFLKL